jgi:hypothetical protein
VTAYKGALRETFEIAEADLIGGTYCDLRAHL